MSRYHLVYKLRFIQGSRIVYMGAASMDSQSQVCSVIGAAEPWNFGRTFSVALNMQGDNIVCLCCLP